MSQFEKHTRSSEINEEWENIKTAIIKSEEKKFNHKNRLQRMNGAMRSADKPLNKRM